LVAATYSFGGSAAPPTQTSFVGFYQLAEISPMKSLTSVMVCGQMYPAYNKSANGGLCPMRGQISLTPPTAPGQYKLVLVPWIASPGQPRWDTCCTCDGVSESVFRNGCAGSVRRERVC
jgi:hypothetical protein